LTSPNSSAAQPQAKNASVPAKTDRRLQARHKTLKLAVLPRVVTAAHVKAIAARARQTRKAIAQLTLQGLGRQVIEMTVAQELTAAELVIRAIAQLEAKVVAEVIRVAAKAEDIKAIAQLAEAKVVAEVIRGAAKAAEAIKAANALAAIKVAVQAAKVVAVVTKVALVNARIMPKMVAQANAQAQVATVDKAHVAQADRPHHPAASQEQMPAVHKTNRFIVLVRACAQVAVDVGNQKEAVQSTVARNATRSVAQWRRNALTSLPAKRS